MGKMTKTIIGFTALGMGAYLAYKNKDKIKDMASNVATLMRKEANSIEDMM